MRILFLTLSLFVSFGTYAHQDMIISVNKEDIHFQYKTGRIELEIGKKVDILLDLSAKLVKEKGYSNEKIYIYFDHDYTKRDSSYWALGFGQFLYWDYEKEKPLKDITATGLKLIIRDRDIHIAKLLKLINSAFSNVSFIKSNQQQLIIDQRMSINGIVQFDTLTTIPYSQLEKYYSTSDTTIERLIKDKTYRNLKKTEKNRAIDYYYQNNKFHFYNTRESDKEWSQEQKKIVVTKTYGEDILIVDNILEIFGSFNDGHFIFINDSVFYYIPQLNDKVVGPFKVDSIAAGRPPIHKYYHEYSPVNRFTIFFDNYINFKKAMFFPDSNLVISNFDKLENDFINGILNKQSVKQTDANTNLKLYIILTCLVLSICLNLWLWINKYKQ
jgi:hypothetical protein